MKSKKVKPKCILIVDDDHDLLFVLQSQLKREGYTVFINSGTDDVLEQLSLRKFDIVLLDLAMNMINGSELCRQIKKRSSLSQTKVLIMSGNHNIEETTRECGADGFVAKPLSFEEIKTVLQKYG